MISFVWPECIPYIPWAGGSEVYTTNHLQELLRRNINARVITCSKKAAESFRPYPEVPLLKLENEAQLSGLDDTLIFALHPRRVNTKHQAFVILHVPIKGPTHDDSALFANNGLGNIQPIVTSKFMSNYYQKALGLSTPPSVVHPSVDIVFKELERTPKKSKTRVLFAGRPTQEKGIYTLLASLYMPPLLHQPFTLDCARTINSNDNGEAKAIQAIYKVHPLVNTISPGKTRQEMAKIFTQHDIVVMPSTDILWKEAFGMISVEAQHAGCWVVASRSGGLPETDCGSLILVEPDNPLALAEGISQAIAKGPVSQQQREKAAKKFTAKTSVDQLLEVIEYGK